ncbi:MAG: hypothetical protein ACLP1Q_08365 [Solirubrobacteraceae bacterium]
MTLTTLLVLFALMMTRLDVAEDSPLRPSTSTSQVIRSSGASNVRTRVHRGGESTATGRT